MLPKQSFTLPTLIEKIRSKTTISYLQAETIVRGIVAILDEEAKKGEIVNLHQLVEEPQKSKLIKTARRDRP